MKTKEPGFAIQDSAKEPVPGAVVHCSTPRLLDFSTFRGTKLPEQTGNVDEKKGQGQKVEKSGVES